MPEFMVMVQASEAEADRPAPAEVQALLEGHTAYQRMLREAGAYLDGERLRPSAEGRRVAAAAGRVQVEAGPFGERPLGGYYLVRAENLAEAVRLAQRCPAPPGTSLEVRPVMGSHLEPGMGNQPGRVFAFAVLGQAATEQGWTEVMDRIEAETRDGFPGGRFPGGLRLHAPTTGRRVAPGGGHLAVLDAPFLESKEVIGGLFFMRMATLEEAVRWAGETPFARHGALEVRELWRS